MELDGVNQAAYPPPPQASRSLSSPQNALLFPMLGQSQSVTSLEGGWG